MSIVGAMYVSQWVGVGSHFNLARSSVMLHPEELVVAQATRT
jgi:hypothetical protein